MKRKLLAVSALLAVFGRVCWEMGYYSAWEEHQHWDNNKPLDVPMEPEPIVEVDASGRTV